MSRRRHYFGAKKLPTVNPVIRQMFTSACWPAALRPLDSPIKDTIRCSLITARENRNMRVCCFLLPASSGLPSGSRLGGFPESMLERSIRGAVARHGTLGSKRGPGRDQAPKTRTGKGKSGVGFLASAIVLFSSTLVVAQDYRGTAEQRASCMPDAFRLCASYIPDATKVEMCLRQRKSELSEACRSVFEENADSVVSRVRNESWRTN